MTQILESIGGDTLLLWNGLGHPAVSSGSSRILNGFYRKKHGATLGPVLSILLGISKTLPKWIRLGANLVLKF